MFLFNRSKTEKPQRGELYTSLLTSEDAGDLEDDRDGRRNSRLENEIDRSNGAPDNENSKRKNRENNREDRDKDMPHPILIEHQEYCQIVDIPEGEDESLDVYLHPEYFFCQVSCLDRIKRGGWWGKSSSLEAHKLYLFIDYRSKKFTLCKDLDDIQDLIGQRSNHKLQGRIFQYPLNNLFRTMPIEIVNNKYWGFDLAKGEVDRQNPQVIDPSRPLQSLVRLQSLNRLKVRMIKDSIENAINVKL